MKIPEFSEIHANDKNINPDKSVCFINNIFVVLFQKFFL